MGGAADDDRQAPDRHGAGEQKYIAANVTLQWCGLVANVAMMMSVASLLASLLAAPAATARLLTTAAVAAAAVLIRCLCTTGAARMSDLSSRAVKNAAHADLRKAAAPRRVLFRAGLHGGGRAGRGRGRGSARDVFRRVSAAVFLRHARAADALCRTVLCQYACCVCAARVRSADPGRHCGGADVGKKLLSRYWGSTRSSAIPFWRICRG